MPETATMKTSVVERFLRYVTYDTQSDQTSNTCSAPTCSATSCGTGGSGSTRG